MGSGKNWTGVTPHCTAHSLRLLLATNCSNTLTHTGAAGCTFLTLLRPTPHCKLAWQMSLQSQAASSYSMTNRHHIQLNFADVQQHTRLCSCNPDCTRVHDQVPTTTGLLYHVFHPRKVLLPRLQHHNAPAFVLVHCH